MQQDAMAADAPAARLNDRTSTLSLLATRRSTPVALMGEPGPEGDALTAILKAAARVPDHGKLAPWRFILFRGGAREAIGEVLQARYRALHPDASGETLAFECGRFLRAPVVVGVVSTARAHPKIPEWEQVLSAGAVCQNMLISAAAMGYAAQWLTEWYAFDEETVRAMGLDEGERIAGFVYMGTAREAPMERPRPDLDALVSEYGC
ncbi:nitroreductase family protein [Kaustia mangrovi]|nr:nitroreductase [Kaustia mangrovi]